MITSQEEGRDATEEHENIVSSVIEGSDEKEIIDLGNAIEKVLEKIRWHENQIEERKQDIIGHENQINELRESLRKHVGPLMNQTLSMPQKNESNRESSGATRTLIANCLRKNGKPMDTNGIKDFLRKHGNVTNPSVELSRMTKRGLIERSGRGFYQLKQSSK